MNNFAAKRRGKIRLGKRGEQLARKLLELKGFTPLVANWRHPAGEIDLICLDGRELVFVEVKTRHYRDDLARYSNLSNRQQRRIRQAARQYLRLLNLPELSGRFDVVEIVLAADSNRLLDIRHRVNCQLRLYPGSY